MKVVFYNQDFSQSIPGLKKWIAFIESNNLKSADIKKIRKNLFRARLNITDRLIFSLFKDKRETCLVILEFLANHNYKKSKFINNRATIDYDNITQFDEQDIPTLKHINQKQPNFHYTDQLISLDNQQLKTLEQRLPLFIIGSAGTGKTALLLQAIRKNEGKILYITQSQLLADNARELYNPPYPITTKNQSIDFYSLDNFLQTFGKVTTEKATYQDYLTWFELNKRTLNNYDKRMLYEEFKGVLSGQSLAHAYLTYQEYNDLGVNQSIYTGEDRKQIYSHFERYMQYLKKNQLHDNNSRCHHVLQTEPSKHYDLVVIDEVQDFTSAQTWFILNHLANANRFIMCGDANQIIHPNFFSWAALKSLFYRHSDEKQSTDIEKDNLLHVLNHNYRNSKKVVDLANHILKIKQYKFGSIDKLSHHKINSESATQGNTILLKYSDKALKTLNNSTKSSTDYAVLVLNEEDKIEAKRHFDTPLIFTVKETKGLEYKNIILYDLIGSAEKIYRDLCSHISIEDLKQSISYSRKKDKKDKSFEVFKFYINILYVAITRAIDNIYWVESNDKHPLLQLLPLQTSEQANSIQQERSDNDSWQKQASLLRAQGNTEQADSIVQTVLKHSETEWQTLVGEELDNVYYQALSENDKHAKLKLYEYALVYDDHHVLNNLLQLSFKPAYNPEKGKELLHKKYYMPYMSENHQPAVTLIEKYGIDYRNPFNQTPLMMCAWFFNPNLAEHLIELGANKHLLDNKGYNAFQIALREIYLHPHRNPQAFQQIYHLLRPGTLNIRIYGQFYQIDPNSLEFILIHVMIAIFYDVMPKQMLFGGGAFNTDDIANACFQMPENIIEKTQMSLQAIENVFVYYNKDNPAPVPPLFVTVTPGHYLFNANLSLQINGEWQPIYNILSIDNLTLIHQESIGVVNTDFLYATLLENKKMSYKQSLAQDLVSSQ